MCRCGRVRDKVWHGSTNPKTCCRCLSFSLSHVKRTTKNVGVSTRFVAQNAYTSSKLFFLPPPPPPPFFFLFFFCLFYPSSSSSFPFLSFFFLLLLLCHLSLIKVFGFFVIPLSLSLPLFSSSSSLLCVVVEIISLSLFSSLSKKISFSFLFFFPPTKFFQKKKSKKRNRNKKCAVPLCGVPRSTRTERRRRWRRR